MWICSLHLHIEQKNILQQKLWLDDVIINAGQNLLRYQFPDIDGLHCTLTVAARKCDTLHGGAIQIMHIQSNHWVCIQVKEDMSSVYLYDSKYPTIPSSVIDLILDIVHFEGDVATIKSMCMQQQKGDDSCGLYSMAVATALCNKQNPAAIEWNQALMWQHLLDCFEEEKMTLFPVANHVSNVKETIKTTVMENLHCICRRRYKQKDKMKQYSKCCRWYHVVCLQISISVLVKGRSWTCSICT